MLAGIVSFGVAACGNSRGSDSAKTSNTASTDTLKVAIWDNNQEPGLSKIISDFTAKTGVKAEIQVIPWNEYWTLLEAGA